jgi:hypothetical protein
MAAELRHWNVTDAQVKQQALKTSPDEFCVPGSVVLILLTPAFFLSIFHHSSTAHFLSATCHHCGMERKKHLEDGGGSVIAELP